ncbi:MAG: hypothetical protein BBJ57_05885 [Desulfobacterales bacterium PC51MH44]|nr:MAG: hypothetical protein BBJ57_05885 [Desulfobacterales bacterium PC51MH44]
MTLEPKTPTGNRSKKWLIIASLGIMAFGISFFIYFNMAFPEVRCKAAKHLESPETASDCFECHIKATPKITQDWYESKHGVILVKCFVCHGQPDGKGSVPYAIDPDVDATCRKCHDPSIKKMEAKYGLEPKCNDCHPFHNNSLHHEAYVKPIAKKKIE